VESGSIRIGNDLGDAMSGDNEGAVDLPEEPVFSGEFTLLTYNVAGLPEGLSSSNPEVYMPLISPLLNGYEIALVQEDFWYHQELIGEINHLYLSAPMWEEPTVSRMGDGLNRFSNLFFEDHIRVPWVDCHGELDCSSDCLATKGFSVARTAVAPDTWVDIYNLHAEAGGCPEDLVSREDGFTQLADHILEHSEGMAVIVAGDFNLHESDPVDLDLLEQFYSSTELTDVCGFLDCGFQQIDKIAFRNTGSLLFTPDNWWIPGEFLHESGQDLSDHLPVAAHFSWQRVSP
jgi:hypothetical protein